MIVKRFSRTQILGTSGIAGFQRGRKYDQDLNRLGRMETSHRELTKIGELGKESRKLSQVSTLWEK